MLRDLPAELLEDRAIVVTAEDLEPFLVSWETSPSLQRFVKGVLVDDRVIPSRQSAAPKFPNSEYSLYPPGDYAWNPDGKGVGFKYFPFPMYSLADALAAQVVQRAQYNANKGFTGALYQASMQLRMFAQGDSGRCLAEGACLPTGGHSVWAALPPLPPGANFTAPVVLVVAQADSLDVFHDLAQGADAPLSGLIAMLAAADALAHAGQSAGYPRRLVFAALAGEPLGLMGSRRLLWYMHTASALVRGLTPDLIDMVVEVGQVGRMAVDHPPRLYVHRMRDARFGDASGLVQKFVAAAALTSETKVVVAEASASAPGLPPSSTMALLAAAPRAQAVVLAEHDATFANSLYASRFDASPRVSNDSLAAAALVLARGLHLAASGADPALDSSALALDLQRLQWLVANLSTCLLLPRPGMACPLALQLLTPGFRQVSGEAPDFSAQHYVGVLPLLTRDANNPYLKSDVARLVWNLLANVTADAGSRSPCDPVRNLCDAGEMCVGWRAGTNADRDAASMGRCLKTSVQYVPALSTRIDCANCNNIQAFRWVLSTQAEEWERSLGWPADAMWTESNWPQETPSLAVQQVEPSSVQAAVLASGLLLTATATAAAMLAKRLFEKRFGSRAD